MEGSRALQAGQHRVTTWPCSPGPGERPGSVPYEATSRVGQPWPWTAGVPVASHIDTHRHAHQAPAGTPRGQLTGDKQGSPQQPAEEPVPSVCL